MSIEYTEVAAEIAAVSTIPAGQPHPASVTPDPIPYHAVAVEAGDDGLLLIGTKTDLVSFLRQALDAADALPDVEPDDPDLLARIASHKAAQPA